MSDKQLLPPLYLRAAMKTAGIEMSSPKYEEYGLKGDKLLVYRTVDIPTSKQLGKLSNILSNRGFDPRVIKGIWTDHPTSIYIDGWNLNTGNNRLESPRGYSLNDIAVERAGRNQKSKTRREDTIDEKSS